MLTSRNMWKQSHVIWNTIIVTGWATIIGFSSYIYYLPASSWLDLNVSIATRFFHSLNFEEQHDIYVMLKVDTVINKIVWDAVIKKADTEEEVCWLAGQDILNGYVSPYVINLWEGSNCSLTAGKYVLDMKWTIDTPYLINKTFYYTTNVFMLD